MTRALGRAGRWSIALWLCVVVGGPAPRPASAAPRFDVGIVEPPAGQPVLGPIEIAAEVRDGDAVRVEFFLDTVKIGELAGPPWRLAFDVGESTASRTLAVVAHAADGKRARAELVTPAVRIDDVVDLPLEQLYVTATSGGAPVRDLLRADFRVSEGSVAQRLVTFERGDVPLTAVLLLDSSTSMRGAPLAAALGGARAFAAGMQPLDEAQLLLFSDQVVHRTPFSGDADALVAGLTGAEARGGSAIVDHLLLALLELERRQGRRVVILLSDGVDVESVLGTRELDPVVGRSPALLYWIRLRPDAAGARYRSIWRSFEEHAAELEGLAHLVERSGGRVVEIARVEEAAVAFRTILEELRSQYVLGWYPTGLRHDSSWRRIRVDLARPGVTLRAREGFYDD